MLLFYGIFGVLLIGMTVYSMCTTRVVGHTWAHDQLNDYCIPLLIYIAIM